VLATIVEEIPQNDGKARLEKDLEVRRPAYHAHQQRLYPADPGANAVLSRHDRMREIQPFIFIRI
jgi:hypothetical protein